MRVQWHDSGWTGAVCQAPKLNSACLRLARIGASRNDEAEQAVAGKSIQELDPKDWPCCAGERGMFMAPFEYLEQKVHPYTETSAAAHGISSQEIAAVANRVILGGAGSEAS